MPTTFKARLTLLLGVGLAIRLILGFATSGVAFDLNSYVIVRSALDSHPGHIYELVNNAKLYRWPYLSGFFPFIAVLGTIASHTGIVLTKLIRLPMILADLGLAWVAQDYLRWRGATDTTRLAAAAVIALGPLFIAISAYNGQLEPLAVLPALIAVATWERLPAGSRPWIAGVLIGIGCAIKGLPVLMVLALLPTCSSVREAVKLIAATLVIPLIAIAPWLIADAHDVIVAVKYHGLAGQGGISVIAQPDLASIWLGGPFPRFTGVSAALQGTFGTVILAVAIASIALLLLRRRADPVESAVLLWLTLFAFSANVNPRYAVMGLPFIVISGRIGIAAALQALVLVPTVLLLSVAPGDASLYAFVALMIVFWLASLVSVVVLARHPRSGGQLHSREPSGVASS